MQQKGGLECLRENLIFGNIFRDIEAYLRKHADMAQNPGVISIVTFFFGKNEAIYCYLALFSL